MNFIIIFILMTFFLITLSIKWELEKKICFPWAIFMGLLACLTIALINSAGYVLHLYQQVLIAGSQTVILSSLAILVLFFRNPERKPPIQENTVVSPADGVVKYIKEIQNQEFPFAIKNRKAIPLSEFAGTDVIAEKCVQIGIGMSLLDVHVNRSPLDGRISLLKRIPGKFKSLKNVSSLLENERVVALIESDLINVGIVLIASRLVRRICMYLSEGQDVVIGQRIGMIKFGSQVDVLIPIKETLRVRIKPGDKVKAGLSILASY